MCLARSSGLVTPRPGASASATSVDYRVVVGTPGTATGGGTDYTASASSITILAGNTTGSITLTADDDVIDELDEQTVDHLLNTIEEKRR